VIAILPKRILWLGFEQNFSAPLGRASLTLNSARPTGSAIRILSLHKDSPGLGREDVRLDEVPNDGGESPLECLLLGRAQPVGEAFSPLAATPFAITLPGAWTLGREGGEARLSSRLIFESSTTLRPSRADVSTRDCRSPQLFITVVAGKATTTAVGLGRKRNRPNDTTEV
jgi:hypothetical protein